MSHAQTGKPLADAEVEIRETGETQKSSDEGTFSFSSLKPSTYTLNVRLENFEPQARNNVYVGEADHKQVDFALLPRIVTLDKMVVRADAFGRAPDMAASTKIMNFDEILRAPGALVDIQRVVQNLPSVASGGDNVNEVIVRGGMPGENLLVMDGIEIPNPNHFANQNSGGGVVSLINPLLVKGLTFNAGAPPAQYGGKASSVIDVELRRGNDRIVLGGLDLGMSGAGGHIEGPLWPGATFMASGHRSYLDLMASFEPTVALPRFWGFQGKFTQQAGAHTITTNGIFGRNSITIEDARDIGMDFDVVASGGDVYVGGMSWNAWWSERLSTMTVLSATGNTYDRTLFSKGATPDTGFTNRSEEMEQTAKLSAALDIGDRDRLQTGIYFKRADFETDIWQKPDTLRIHTPADIVDSITEADGEPVIYRDSVDKRDQGYRYGGHVSYIAYLFDRLRVVPGIRFDAFTFNESFTVSPRLNALFPLTDNLDITGAFGVQHQQPEYVDLTKHPANKKLSPKRAVTGIIGAEYTFDDASTKLSVEGFYKRYDNLPVDSAFLYGTPLDQSSMLIDTGKGKAFGVELFAQKKLTDAFFWTLAYSFSRSFYRDMRKGHDDEWYPGDYDFMHGLTLTGGWKTELQSKPWYERLRKRWWFKALSPIMPIADRIEISGKWRYLGGRPYSQPYYSDRYGRWVTDRNDDLNETRYDPYHRLDIRYERRYAFGLLHLIYYFDIQNVYDRSNIWTYLYSDKHQEKKAISQFPFFPVGGIIIGF